MISSKSTLSSEIVSLGSANTVRWRWYPPPYDGRIIAWIDFGKTSCQSHPLDPKRDQPVELIAIPE